MQKLLLYLLYTYGIATTNETSFKTVVGDLVIRTKDASQSKAIEPIPKRPENTA